MTLQSAGPSHFLGRGSVKMVRQSIRKSVVKVSPRNGYINNYLNNSNISRYTNTKRFAWGPAPSKNYKQLMTMVRRISLSQE